MHDHLLAHQMFLERLARRLVTDEAAAQDLVQDTWLRALARPPRERGALRGWLGTVARHLALERMRAGQRRRDHERRAARAAVTDGGLARVDLKLDFQAVLLERLRALPEAQRHVLALRYVEDLMPHEIARQLGVSVTTVKARLRRGLAALRESLDREAGGERGVWALTLLPDLGREGSVAAAQGSGGLALVVGPAGWKLSTAALVLAALVGGWWLVRDEADPSAGGSLTAPQPLVERHGVDAELLPDARSGGRETLAATPLDTQPAEEPPAAQQGAAVYAALLGRIDLEGGTQSVVFDGRVFEGGAVTGILGSFRNKTSRVQSGVTVSIERDGPEGHPPRAWRMSVGSQLAFPASMPEGVAATVTGLSLRQDEELALRIQGVESRGASMLTVSLTPSFRVWVGGALREGNSLPAFELGRSNRPLRQEAHQVWHDALVAELVHTSQDALLTRLEGELGLPEDAASKLMAVHLLDVLDDHRPLDSTCSIDGSKFELSGFAPLSSSGRYEVVLAFSDALRGQPVQMGLKASFER